MAQITHGLRSILSHPFVYSFFQKLMGARQGIKHHIEHHIKPFPGMKILDIGCGPADILGYMDHVEYYGFDISEPYIQHAESTFGKKGRFFCKMFTRDDLESLPRFDLVLATGLLHHLEDHEAQQLMQLAHDALNEGGRFITLDGVFEAGQNPIARFLISQDRGQNVRTKAGYEGIARSVFKDCHITIRHKTWIPYTHCIMECFKDLYKKY